MLCHQCGSPVSSTDTTCSNCQAELKRSAHSASLRADGLKRMSRQLRAVQVEARFFPVNEVVSDRFTLGELIGKGPFGEVYRAKDSLIDSEVALKIFAPELIANPQDQEQFLKVARTARTLTQPNVVRVHSGGVHKDHAWISMQTLEGLSLRKVMKMRRQKREHFPLDEIEPLIAQITLALGHVHREFPVGNLKPENIILMPDLLKITDHYFLAAFSAGAIADQLADSRYLAPELRVPASERRAIGEVDSRCDVFSLGAILGEMVFGPDYVAGASNEPADALDALCRRACAPHPADRYESVEALSEDFSTLVDTGGLLGYGGARAGDDAQGAGAPLAPPPAPRVPPAPPRAPALEGAGLAETSGAAGPPPAPLASAAEDLATREFVRGGDDEAELGDLLATNEVRRGEHGPKVAPAAPSKHPQDRERKKTLPLSALSPASDEPTATAVKPMPPAADPKKSDDSAGLSPGLILAGLAALLVVAGVFIWGRPAAESERIELDNSNALAQAAEADSGALGTAGVADAGEGADAKEELAARAQASAERVRIAAEAQAAVAANAPDAAEDEAEKEAEKIAADEKAAADALLAANAAAAAEKPVAVAANEAKGAREAKTPEAARGAAVSPTKASKPAAAEPAAKPAAAGTTCKSGMKLMKTKKGNYCIDAYEYPGRGSKPSTNVSWFKAKQLCEARGQRLCGLPEWRQACGGTYPYGKKWDADRCNTVDEDDFERSLAPAGSFKGCRSRSGAYDMTGNAHEWVVEQRIVGGGYDSGEDVATCGYSSAKAPGSSGSNIGFRCCADAE